MSFTITTIAANRDSAATITATGTATAGHTVAVFVWNYSPTTNSLSDTGGSTWVAKTSQTFAAVRGQWFYTLSQVGSGSTTYTNTLGASTVGSILVFDLTATGAISFDVEGGANGLTANPDSGAFTTTGSDEIVLAGIGDENGTANSAMLINAVAADGTDTSQGNTAIWWKAFGSTLTNAHATLTKAADKWALPVISFKAAASGIAIPVLTRQYRQRWS